MTPCKLTAIGGASAFSKPHSIRPVCTELPAGKTGPERMRSDEGTARVLSKRDVASQTAFERRIVAATTVVGAGGERASRRRRCAT